jgi:cell division protein FtsQ
MTIKTPPTKTASKPPTKARPSSKAKPPTTKTAPTPKAKVRTPVDPRLRDRWVAARRAEGRRRLRIVLIAVGVVVALVVAWAVIASPFLDVDHIEVKGATQTSIADIERASGIGRGDPMVWIDTGEAVSGIEALPWVQAAHVHREWPGTVTISVTEREAVAWVDAGGATLVDRTGRVLAHVAAPPTDLPQIADMKTVPPVGVTISPAVGARVAGRLEGLARSGTRTIALTKDGVVLELVRGPEIRLGEPTEVMTKVRSALAVLTALGDAQVSYIDASVPSNPVAGPVAQ